MVELGSSLGLAEEAFFEGGVQGSGGQELDGDPAVQPRIPGEIDDAEAAFPQLLEDLVVPERTAPRRPGWALDWILVLTSFVAHWVLSAGEKGLEGGPTASPGIISGQTCPKPALERNEEEFFATDYTDDTD
jgi:hypothetical protein